MRLVLIGTVLVTAATVTLAQTPAQQTPPRFRAAVDLMRIEATVLDRRTRKPIRGLTAADFVVKVNGDPQEIEVLDEVEVPGVETNRGKPFPEAARDIASNTFTRPRLFVIVMDDAVTSKDLFGRQKGKDIAHAVVDGLGPNDMASVVFAQDNRHAQDFTTDRAALRRAIETFTPRSLDPIMAGLMSVSVLERASAFLRRMPGYRRSIVWITLGPGGADLEDESLMSWQLEPPGALNVTAGEGQEALRRATNRVAGAVAAVPVYAYSLEGLRPMTASETRGGAMPSLFGNATLDRLATASGGRQIYNTNAPDLAVPSMFTELSSYYTIAFRTSFPMDGKQRWLEVEVKRPGVIISPPDTSFAAPKDMSDVGPAPRAAAPAGLVEALSGPLPRGDVRLLLGHVPVAVAGSKEHAVALTLGIPRPVAGSPPQQFGLNLFVYDGEGRRRIIAQSQDVTVQPRSDDTNQPAEVAIPLRLSAGRYLVRVAVNDKASGLTGSVYTTVTVPDFAKEPLSMSGVAIGRLESGPIGGRETVESFLPFAPTVVREFSASDRVGALVRLHQAAGERVDVRLDSQILDATGAVVSSESSTLRAAGFADHRGVEVRSDLRLRGLPPGEYLLRLVASQAGTRVQVTREVRFSIR